jgi:predicted SprT family Zn-dependent metalloprotease
VQKITRIALLFLVASCATKTPIKQDPVYEGSYYVNESSLEWVSKLIDVTDCTTKLDSFHKDIIDNNKYEHYEGSNEKIVKDLKSDVKAHVGTYYKRFTRARAYRNVGSNKIWLNRAKISGKIDVDLVNTMIHERLHVLGYQHKGNNKYKYNNVESVPYKVGKISEKYSQECINRKTQ